MNQNSHTKQKSARLIRRITLTALFTAFALVIKCFTKVALTIPGIGVQISFAGIFTFFPAILFGPLYGGAASALTDFLGAMIVPTGAYIPWLTVTAFLGGCLKGLLWRWMKNGVGVRAKAALLACVVLAGVFGLSVQLSLHADGVSQGFFVKQADLPAKQEINAGAEDFSPLTRFTVQLAKYNKDTLTPTAIRPAEGATLICLPRAGDIAAKETTAAGDKLAPLSYTLKKLSSGVLANCAGIPLYIPENYTDIADDAAGDATAEVLSAWVIYGKEGSAAEKYAAKIGAQFVSGKPNVTVDGTCLLVSRDGVTYEAAGEGYTISFKSSDTYRKYLANYLNLASAGLELFALFALAFYGIVWLLRTFRAKRGEKTAADAVKSGPDSVSYLKIFLTILLPGLVVTTINTFVLRIFLPAYSGRAILILWIPRLCEELVVCLAQAYLISLLYGVLIRGRLKSVMDKYL